MKRKVFLCFLAIVFCAVSLIAVQVTAAKNFGYGYGRQAHRLPSNGQIYHWIKDLWRIGKLSPIGFRYSGTRADHIAARYISRHFRAFGLKDVQLYPVNFPFWKARRWKLKVSANGTTVRIPCSYRPYTQFTSREGLTAEMVYVGTGMDPDSFADVEGKIVLVDLIAPGLTYDGVFEPLSLFTYDPDDTLPGAKVTQNWPVFNILSSYQMAVENGAVGFIGILGFDLADTDEYFSPYNAVLGEIAGVYVSKSEGDYLKELLEENDYVDANIVLRGKAKEGLTYNVIGWIPGESDEVILVTSHYDGWAVNDASGTSIVMALAKYFGQFRTPVTKRSLLFIASAGHFIGDIPTRTFIEENPDLVSRIVVDLNVEHIAKEIVGKDGMLVPTGLVAPRAFFISGPSKGGNPYLTQIASDAVERYRLKRTVAVPADLLGPHPPGIAHWYHQAGVPVLDFISGPAIMFTPMDKPNKVAVSQLRPVTAAFIKMIKDLDDIPADWLKGEGPSEESE